MVQFVHIPKTGGQFIIQQLQYLGFSTPTKYHTSLSDQDRDVVGFSFIRNPIDWYESWYSFCVGMLQEDVFFSVMSNNKTLDVNQTVARALYPPLEVLDQLKAALSVPTTQNPIHNCVTANNVSDWLLLNRGLYSFIILKLLTRNHNSTIDLSNVHLFKYSKLREDLLSALSSYGVTITEKQRQTILTALPTNRTDHKYPLSNYTKHLIVERECQIYDMLKDSSLNPAKLI